MSADGQFWKHRVSYEGRLCDRESHNVWGLAWLKQVTPDGVLVCDFCVLSSIHQGDGDFESCLVYEEPLVSP